MFVEIDHPRLFFSLTSAELVTKCVPLGKLYCGKLEGLGYIKLYIGHQNLPVYTLETLISLHLPWKSSFLFRLL